MDKKLSFIGAGNMGGALIQAACRALNPSQVSITDYSPDKARHVAQEQGCQASGSNREAVLFGDYIFLCVKPQVIGSVLGSFPGIAESFLSSALCPTPPSPSGKGCWPYPPGRMSPREWSRM